MKNYNNFTKEELIELLKKQDEELASKKYGLVWDTEKEQEQVVIDCKNKLPILKHLEEKDIKTDNGDCNIMIEGDNYHALQVLNYTHKGKIDVIYIDPPYNTGNKDFKYNDRFVDKEDGYRHSKWLNFMEKRLDLAKNLLKEDGVIFISIDDNEQANLKLLCDKIFGEDNFIGTIPNKVRTGKNDVSFNFSQDYDWVVCYTRCKNKRKKLFKRKIERKYYKSEDYPDDEWRLNPMTTQRTIKERPNSDFTMINPKNNQEFPVNPNRSWAVTKDTFLKYYKSGKIVFPGDYDFLKISSPALRVFKSEEIKKNGDDFNITSISSDLLQNNKELKSTDLMSLAGTKEIMEVFGEKIFSNPKPIKLIKLLTELSCNKNSTILDFFAGSGTTGHAILELNKEDNGNRKFILCTNNEENIATEICYPRIKKVINGYRKNGNGNFVEGSGGNLKYYQTDFVNNSKNDLQLRFNLTQKCTEMLCLKENIFNLIKEHQNYKIFSNNEKNEFLGVYYDFMGDDFKIFLEELRNIDKNYKKHLYIFSLSNKIDKEIFGKIDNIEIEAIPQKIMELYKKIQKEHTKEN